MAHRIDSATVEADKFGVGKDGFTSGTAPTTPPTDLTAEWCDEVQEEICNAIEDGGGALVKGNTEQLSSYLRRLAIAPALSNWTANQPGKNFDLYCAAESPAALVAVGAADGADAYILSSPDGVTWTERANAKNFTLYSMAWASSLSLFVAVGAADGADAYILSSPDGVTWTERANPKNFALSAVSWSEDLTLFVAGGANDGTDAYLITSPDGITWTERASNTTSAITTVAWSSALTLFVAGLSNSADVLTSPDGLTWSVQSSVLTAASVAYDVVWSAFYAKFFLTSVVGGAWKLNSSADGLAWTGTALSFTATGLACLDNFGAIVIASDRDTDSGARHFVYASTDEASWGTAYAFQADTAARSVLFLGHAPLRDQLLLLGDSAGGGSPPLLSVSQHVPRL